MNKNEYSFAKRLYEEAIEKVGFDFSSSALWEELLKLSQDDKYKVFSIYRRVLGVPLKNLDDFREKFNGFFLTCTLE